MKLQLDIDLRLDSFGTSQGNFDRDMFDWLQLNWISNLLSSFLQKFANWTESLTHCYKMCTANYQYYFNA